MSKNVSYSNEIHSSMSIQDEDGTLESYEYETQHYSYYDNEHIYNGDNNNNDDDINYDEEYNEQKEKDNNDDEEYSGEIGYWIVKLLRGTTAGRQLKRNIAKFTCYQIAAGIPFIIISAIVERSYNMSIIYTLSKYGASLLNLTYLIAICTLFLALCSILIIRYWASICTNRKLLLEIMRIYIILFIVVLILLVWLWCALFMTFKRVTNIEWTSNIVYTALFPVYLSTIIFGIPYTIALVYYCLDIWYLIFEIAENGADIEEPDIPSDVADLSDVSLKQALFFILVIPCVLSIQFVDLISAICRACSRYRAYRRKKAAEKEEKSIKSKRRSIFERIITTFTKRIPFSTSVLPTDDSVSDKYVANVQLQDMEKGREEIEQMERDRAEFEASRRRNIEEHSRKQEILEERERQRQYEEEQERQRIEEEKIREEDATNAYVLNITQFKTKWKSLPTGGSFQCKLKALPSILILTEHLQQKGFHIVYSSSGKTSDIEIGISNTRTTLNDGWFMARFLASSSSFSSVMKSDNPSDIKIYVKLFELAKVIKIQIEKTES